MIPIDDDYVAYLSRDEQVVRPVITAVWADSKSLDNLICSSSSDFYMPTTAKFKPTLWWKLNDSASPVGDSSGNDHIGTATNIARFNDSGIIYDDVGQSYSMRFKGTSKVVTPNTDDLNPNNNFVLEMFCNFRNAANEGVSFPFGGGDYILAAKAAGTSNSERQYEILVHSDGTSCKFQGNVYIGGHKYSITDTHIINTTTDYYIALQVYNNTLYFTVNNTFNTPVTIFTAGLSLGPMSLSSDTVASNGRYGICAGQAGHNQVLANKIKALWTTANNVDTPVVRMDCSWAANQPGNAPTVAGMHNDTSFFAANIGAALTFHKNAGNQVILVLGIDTPVWAGGNTFGSSHVYPNDNKDFANFCWLVVDYVETNFPGMAFGYELWNEPNNGFGMEVTDKTLYTPFFNAGATAIKTGVVTSGNNHTGYPSVKVCSAGMGPITPGTTNSAETWAAYMVAHGSGPLMDAFAIHPYGLQCPPTNNAGWNQRLHVIPQIRSSFDGAGFTGVKIWVTEDGCFTRADGTPTNTGDTANCGTLGTGSADAQQEVTEAVAATRITQQCDWYLNNKTAYGIDILCYYEFEDTDSTWSNSAGIYKQAAGHNGAAKTEVKNAFVAALTKASSGSPGRTPPTAAITSPVDDPTHVNPLSGTVTFLLAGTDTFDPNRNLTAEFYKDNGATKIGDAVFTTALGWHFVLDTTTLSDADYQFKVKFTNTASPPLSTFSVANRQRIQNAVNVPFPIGFGTGAGLVPQAQIDSVKLCGGKFVRMGVSWDSMSTNVDVNFDKQNAVKNSIAACNAAGVDVVLQIAAGNTYGGIMYDHNVNFAKFIKNVAAVFNGTSRASGKYVVAIEIGNEMNHDKWDSRPDNWVTHTTGDKGRAYADLMIRLMNPSFENIKSVNSTTPIIIGGLGGEDKRGNDVQSFQFTKDCHTSVTVTAGATTITFPNGIKNHFDGWNIHPYCYQRTAVGDLPGDNQPTRGWNNMIDIMNWFKSVQGFYPSLYITEWGDPTNIFNSGLTLDQQYQHAASCLSDPVKGAIAQLRSFVAAGWPVKCLAYFSHIDQNQAGVPPDQNDNHWGVLEFSTDMTPKDRGAPGTGAVKKEHLWQTYHDFAIASASFSGSSGVIKTQTIVGGISNTKLTGTVTTHKIPAGSFHSQAISSSIPLNKLTGSVTTNVIIGGGPRGSFAIGDHPSIHAPIPVANIQSVAFFNGTPFYPIVHQTRYLSALNTGPLQYTKDYYTADQAANGFEQESFLFAALDAIDNNGNVITANGSYSAPESDPTNRQFEYGWWSRQASNGIGAFATPEMLTVEFDVRFANSINVFTSQYFGPVSLYDIYYKDDTDTWNLLLANQSFADGVYENIHSLTTDGTAIKIKGIYLIIYATKYPGDVARIQEIAPIFSEDVSDDVVSFTANKVRDNYDSTVPVGITQTNTFTLVLQNVDQKYSKYNTESPIFGYVEPEVRFNVGVNFIDPGTPDGGGGGGGTPGAGTYGSGLFSDGTYGTGDINVITPTPPPPTTDVIVKFIPIGTFFSDEATTSTDQMTSSFNTRDRSKYFQDNTVDGFLFANKTVPDAIRYLARYGNVYNSNLNIQQKYLDKVYSIAPFAYVRFNESTNSTPCAILPGSTGANAIVNLWAHPNNGVMSYNLDFDDPCTNLTIEFWAKLDGHDRELIVVNDLNNFSIISMGISSSQVHLNFFSDFFSPHSGAQYFNCPELLDSRWHHVALTYDSVANGAWAFYVDGIKLANNNIGSSVPLANEYFKNITIGGGSNNIALFADVRLWTKTMVNNDILDIMDPFLMGNEDSLYVLWDFSEALASTNGTLPATISKTNGSYWLAAETQASFNAGTDFLKCFSDEMLTLNFTDVDGLMVKAQQGPLTSTSDPTNSAINNSDDSAYVQSLGNSKTDNINKFSFAGLVSMDNFPLTKGYLFSAHTHSTGSIGLYFDENGFLTFEVVGQGTLVSDTAIAAGDGWHHVAVIHNKNVTTPRTSLYLDGVKVGSVTNLFNAGKLLPSWIQVMGTDQGPLSFLGSISEFAFFDTLITAQDITDMFNCFISPQQDVYSYLYSVGQTIWDSMLQMALPDFGMFYFDEFDKFNYESSNTLYSSLNSRFSTPQFVLNDTDFIESADEQLQLMANKVEVKLYSQTAGASVDDIWQAPDGESLAVTSLLGTIDKFTATIGFNTIPSPDGTPNVYTPTFPATGYFRVDNEIIQFAANTKGQFSGCIRGQFGTVPAPHTTGAGLYEVRIYNMTFSSTPVSNVKYPFITAVQKDLAVVYSWTPTSFGGTLLLGSSDPNVNPHYVLLEATDPLSNLQYNFVVAGTVINQNTSSQTVQSILVNAAPEIRKYRLRAVTIDNPFVTTTSQANNIGNYIIGHFKDGAQIDHVTTIGLPHLQLSDRITIGNLNSLSIFNQDFWIIENDITYDGSLTQAMTLRQVV